MQEDEDKAPGSLQPSEGASGHRPRADDPNTLDLFEEVERRAYLELPDTEEPEPLDVLASLSSEPGAEVDAGTTGDLTLGGYVEKHTRPPAFSGADGQPYTVDVDVEPTGDRARPFAAFLVFVRWAATGAGIMEHAESDDVAFGSTAEEAREHALELTLYEVKAELDAAVLRKQRELEE